jgi:hypothetical protein
VKAFEKCKSFRSQEKGKNSYFLGGGVGDRKLIKDRLRIRTALREKSKGDLQGRSEIS